MSDIVHRLRTAIVLLDAEREEAAAEIERLRDKDSYIKALHIRAKEYEQEIERLRSALEDCQNLDEAPDLRTEIERLRSALETISIVEAGSAAAASMRLIAVRALSDKKEPNNG